MPYKDLQGFARGPASPEESRDGHAEVPPPSRRRPTAECTAVQNSAQSVSLPAPGRRLMQFEAGVVEVANCFAQFGSHHVGIKGEQSQVVDVDIVVREVSGRLARVEDERRAPVIEKGALRPEARAEQVLRRPLGKIQRP